MPDTVTPGDLNWPYTVAITAVHVLALAALVPWLFTWTGLIVMILGVHVFGQGINMCYHRQLTHRSFRTPRWLEHFFVVLALCCMQDTPGKWVATHRYHHNHSDKQPDPHSPLVTFLWSHVGWLLIRNRHTHSISTYQRFAGDILRDPWYMRLEKSYQWVWFYVGHAMLFFAAAFAAGFLIWGTAAAALQLALSIVVWGVLVRTVVVWHITWSVNSLSHLFGYSSHETGENSKNNWLVALLTVGEGWHNNHHHDPAAASVQHRWWEIDITYYEIRLLEMLGLAERVVPLKRIRQARRDAAAE
ncbi:MAG: fatty acid desaturase [Phycisphaeraceae bacterium]